MQRSTVRMTTDCTLSKVPCSSVPVRLLSFHDEIRSDGPGDGCKPSTELPAVTCRAVSDSWHNSDAVLALSFKSLQLPGRAPPHTDLLDLDPLPVSALDNPAYQSMYGFSHFNAIQTQVCTRVSGSAVTHLLLRDPDAQCERIT